MTPSATPCSGDPNIEFDIKGGGDYEALYFQQLDGPVRRRRLPRGVLDVDRPPGAVRPDLRPDLRVGRHRGHADQLRPDRRRARTARTTPSRRPYDPAAAEAMLTEAGWAKDGSGFWAKDGAPAPEIRWMVNAGNTRRENTQAYLIPLLAAGRLQRHRRQLRGRVRLPAAPPSPRLRPGDVHLDGPAGPAYLIPSFTCENIPTEENDFQGQNQPGWCNEEASAGAQRQRRHRRRRRARASSSRAPSWRWTTDHVLLPLVTYPKSGIWRTDKVGGPVADETSNYRAFTNFHLWEDVDGDGQIVIGAEQWPGCLNPVTECANSSWYVWTVSFPTLPGHLGLHQRPDLRDHQPGARGAGRRGAVTSRHANVTHSSLRTV